MFKVRTRKVRKCLGIYIRRREVAGLKVAPSLRVLEASHAKAGAGGKGCEILEGAAETGEDQGVNLGAQESGGLGRDVGAVAMAYESYFACIGVLAAKGNERVEGGSFYLELCVVVGVDAVQQNQLKSVVGIQT